MSELKIGDKLLCKISMLDDFYEDKYYIVTNIKKDTYSNCDNYLYNITNEITNQTCICSFNEEYLYNYFYSNSELRKYKLKKLNENFQ